MMCYNISINPLFQIFTQSIDAIDVKRVTLCCLNSINAIDVARGECQMSNVKLQMSNVKSQMSNVKSQMSNVKLQMSNVK